MHADRGGRLGGEGAQVHVGVLAGALRDIDCETGWVILGTDTILVNKDREY